MKLKNHFRILAFSILLSLLCMPLQARAQQSISLAAVEVDLWPEFDHPTMLVIYRITLSPQVSLPVELGISMPAAAGAPNAVAVKQPDGSLINLPYDQQDQGGGWSRLVFSATALELQIEYYDPGLVKDGPKRHFEYRWPGDYAVEALTVEVQQPLGGVNMRISPSMGSGVSGNDGLVYFTQQVGALAAGQSFDITLDYDKANEDLSAGSMGVAPGSPIGETAAGRNTFANALPWALGIVGILLIAGGAFWYWQSGRKPQSSKAARRPRTRTVKDESPPSSDAVYCHQCGKRAAGGDRFCRACGAELRIG